MSLIHGSGIPEYSYIDIVEEVNTRRIRHSEELTPEEGYAGPNSKLDKCQQKKKKKKKKQVQSRGGMPNVATNVLKMKQYILRMVGEHTDRNVIQKLH